jgi:hypothetical protein
VRRNYHQNAVFSNLYGEISTKQGIPRYVSHPFRRQPGEFVMISMQKKTNIWHFLDGQKLEHLHS